MTKTALSTPKSTLARTALDEIAEETRAHRLRAINFRYERRLHDIESRYFEDRCQARADYMRDARNSRGSGEDSVA